LISPAFFLYFSFFAPNGFMEIPAPRGLLDEREDPPELDASLTLLRLRLRPSFPPSLDTVLAFLFTLLWARVSRKVMNFNGKLAQINQINFVARQS
jgi:hypothetical protein